MKFLNRTHIITLLLILLPATIFSRASTLMLSGVDSVTTKQKRNHIKKKRIIEFRIDWRRISITIILFIFFIIGLIVLGSMGPPSTIYTDIIARIMIILVYPLGVVLELINIEPPRSLRVAILLIYAYILSYFIVFAYDKFKKLKTE